MDTLRVVLQDMIFVNIPLSLNGTSLLVAFSADPGDALWRNSRARVSGLNDFVVAVAVLALGCQRVATGYRLSVERC